MFTDGTKLLAYTALNNNYTLHNNCTVHFYAYQHLKWLKHDESVNSKDMYMQKKGRK